MKYWVSASGRWNSRGAITLNMLVEFLESFDYEIIRRPIMNKTINGLVIYRGDRGLTIPNSGDSGVAYLVDASADSIDFLQEASSFIVLADNESCIPKNPSPYEKRCLNSSVVVKRKVGVTIRGLENDITNYMLAIEKFVSALTVVEISKSGYQGLIDVAEEFFGCFISLCDADYKLLAYTKHIEPADSVNSSLVKLRYHADDFLKAEIGEGYISEKIINQRGVATFPPTDEGGPCCLVTAPVTVHGHMVAYLVMLCPKDEVSKGTEDTFGLLVDKCQKIATYFYEDSAKVEPGRMSLFLNLVSDPGIDSLFTRQRAERLGIPFFAFFTVVKMCWDDQKSSCLGFYVDDINHMSQEESPISFISIRYSRSVVTLVIGTSICNMVDSVRSLLEKDFAVRAKHVYVSDPFQRLDEVSLGYRTIATIEKHERDIGLICSALSRDIPHILTFRDAFCFYWNDPYKDETVQNFVISHMVVNEIARNDRLENTDYLQLLLIYLVNERHAKTVAEKCQLSRSGVLYKINRIEEKYSLDLDDYLIRQYIQACIRVLNSLNNEADVG